VTYEDLCARISDAFNAMEPAAVEAAIGYATGLRLPLSLPTNGEAVWRISPSGEVWPIVAIAETLESLGLMQESKVS
jgi:hypothetical protein